MRLQRMHPAKEENWVTDGGEDCRKDAIAYAKSTISGGGYGEFAALPEAQRLVTRTDAGDAEGGERAEHLRGRTQRMQNSHRRKGHRVPFGRRGQGVSHRELAGHRVAYATEGRQHRDER